MVFALNYTHRCCCAPIESFLVIELNDFGVLTSWFILKAHTADIAKKWMDHISSAQVGKVSGIFYTLLGHFLELLMLVDILMPLG